MISSPRAAEDAADVILVGGDAALSRLLARSLAGTPRGSLAVRQVGPAGFRPQGRPALIVIDLDLCNDLDLVSRCARSAPIIAVASGATTRLVVEVLRRGAADFLSRPVAETDLNQAVGKLLGESEPKHPAFSPDVSHDPLSALLGSSPEIDAVRAAIRSAAPSAAAVFLHGEAGTGKHLCAEAIHRLSPRADAPMISLDCLAVPRDQLESELFGREQEALADAPPSRGSAALLADGGTLFLAEICEMDLDLQARLAQLIRTGVAHKADGRRIDVRFVFSTSRDPLEAVGSGRLNADLFNGPAILPVALPPLCERGGDAIEIAEAMLPRIAVGEGRRSCCLDGDAKRLILSHGWPGNVRELLNVLRNAVAMNETGVICGTALALALAYGDRDLGGLGSGPGAGGAVIGFRNGAASGATEFRSTWNLEDDIVESVPAAPDGKVSRATIRPGVDTPTMRRKRRS